MQLPANRLNSENKNSSTLNHAKKRGPTTLLHNTETLQAPTGIPGKQYCLQPSTHRMLASLEAAPQHIDQPIAPLHPASASDDKRTGPSLLPRGSSTNKAFAAKRKMCHTIPVAPAAARTGPYWRPCTENKNLFQQPTFANTWAWQHNTNTIAHNRCGKEM